LSQATAFPDQLPTKISKVSRQMQLQEILKKIDLAVNKIDAIIQREDMANVK
jgi:hypothetical protein